MIARNTVWHEFLT